ncbi:MAG: DUF3888 domain-containing protein [Mycobacterium leprae]
MPERAAARIRSAVITFLVFITVESAVAFLSPNQAAAIAAPQGAQWENVRPDDSFALVFLHAVRPQIQAAITGAYGGTPLYENVRVVAVRRLKSDPQVADVEIRADTFEGAHNPLGTVTVVFRSTPLQLIVGEVTVRKAK